MRRIEPSSNRSQSKDAWSTRFCAVLVFLIENHRQRYIAVNGIIIVFLCYCWIAVFLLLFRSVFFSLCESRLKYINFIVDAVIFGMSILDCLWSLLASWLASNSTFICQFVLFTTLYTSKIDRSFRKNHVYFSLYISHSFCFVFGWLFSFFMLVAVFPINSIFIN